MEAKLFLNYIHSWPQFKTLQFTYIEGKIFVFVLKLFIGKKWGDSKLIEILISRQILEKISHFFKAS